MREDFSPVIEELIAKLKSEKFDMLVRCVPFLGGKTYICYIGQLVDRQSISEHVIKPLVDISLQKVRGIDAEFAVDHMFYVDECHIGDDLNLVKGFLLNGQTVVFFSSDSRYVIVNRKKVENRTVSPPELMYSYRAPRDSFVEDMDTNLSLLRYRIKDDNIRIIKKDVGSRTKTSVAVVYLNDIANQSVVKEVLNKIDGIKVSGVFESGELQGFLSDGKTSLFPKMGIIERSDMAVEKLLEGKVLLLVSGSNLVIQAPIVFAEFVYSCDDRYDNKFFGLFMRLIRYTAIIVSLTITSLYIAVSAFHPDVLPAYYTITFAQMRSRAPVSSFIAVLSLEFILELVREALLRVPVKIGSAIAIVGAIIIGQAATASGIFSPLLLILVSIGFLSTFVIPDFMLSNVLRIVKFLIIIMTGIFGFYGFSIAITFILSVLVSANSFGVPYFAPWAPFNLYDAVRTFIFSRGFSPERQKYMRNQDKMRSPGKKGGQP
ncbi:MAG: spore germination protein [Bacillota bacterium]|nr:spore germination protein [Bacillota bacterium]